MPYQTSAEEIRVSNGGVVQAPVEQLLQCADALSRLGHHGGAVAIVEFVGKLGGNGEGIVCFAAGDLARLLHTMEEADVVGASHRDFRQDYVEPDSLLVLGKVFLCLGLRQEAWDVFHIGLFFDPSHPYLLGAVAGMGKSKRQYVLWFSRDSFLNPSASADEHK